MHMRLACSGLYAIAKYGYPPSLPNTYRALGDMAMLGFKYVELEGVGEVNLRAIWSERDKLLRHAASLGLSVVNFCPVLPDIVSLDPAARDRAKSLYELAIETASYFGCHSIQTDSFTGPLVFADGKPYSETITFGHSLRVVADPEFDWTEVWNVLVETMRYCSQTARNAGLRFCLEPRMGELVSNTDGFLRLADAVNEENFGILLDTGHQHAQKEILVLSVEKLRDRIGYVHVADNDSTINEHRPLGQGTIDWDNLLLALQKHRFGGYLAIDVGGIGELDRGVVESRNFITSAAARLGIALEG